MAQLELKAEARTVHGKHVRHLRREGIIPAVLYGHKTQPTSLQVDARELRGVLREAGTTHLISLQRGSKKPVVVLVREVQRSPIDNRVLHVDFYQVVMTEKITVAVPLTFVGTAPAMAQPNTVMLHGLEEVEIECLPGDLIETIEVDLSALVALDDAIHVKDLNVPSTIRILNDPEEVVAKVVVEYRPVAEEVAEVVISEPGEVEVVARGRRVEEESEE
jgi:large subunit ribosomal protein L25